jgi:hypothetical protein
MISEITVRDDVSANELNGTIKKYHVNSTVTPVTASPMRGPPSSADIVTEA